MNHHKNGFSWLLALAIIVVCFVCLNLAFRSEAVVGKLSDFHSVNSGSILERASNARNAATFDAHSARKFGDLTENSRPLSQNSQNSVNFLENSQKNSRLANSNENANLNPNKQAANDELNSLLQELALLKEQILKTNDENASLKIARNLLQRDENASKALNEGNFTQDLNATKGDLKSNLKDLKGDLTPNFKTLKSNLSQKSSDFNLSKAQLFASAGFYGDIFSPLKKEYFEFYERQKKGDFKGLDGDFKPNTNDKKEQKIHKNVQKSIPKYNKNAKLVIIIDDLATPHQVNALKSTRLRLTPSFFPPSKTHPQTPVLARHFDFYMVHLPLSAVNYAYEEAQTLHPSDSAEFIDLQIQKIRQAFPKAKFINNHTGSLFTSDLQAMKRLLKSLKRYGFIFVDSLTTKSSTAAFATSEVGQGYIKRDVFLDNIDEVGQIKAKISEAVNLAHKNGVAIAIAHPKKNTFAALKESQKLLKSVNLLYLNEVFDESFK